MSWETKSCTVFDVSGLTEVKMRPFYGWRGRYYVDENGICVAKTCRSCRITLPVSSFTVCNDNSSGYRGNCKSCTNKKQLPRRDDYRKVIIKKYSSRSQEQLDSDMKRLHPDGTKWCFKCRTTKELSGYYRDKTKSDSLRQVCTPCEIKSAVIRQKNKFVPYWSSKNIPLECYVCGDPWEDADHVVAEKRGGSDDSYNRLPICGSCNSSKYMHPLEDWIRRKYPDIADEVLHRVTVEYGITI